MAKIEFKPEVVKLTLTLLKRQGDELRALRAITLQAKNIYNTTLYLVRQIFSAYDYDSATQCNRLKPSLRPEQQAAIDHVNAVIDATNQARRAKYPGKLAQARAKGVAEDKLPKLKLIQPLTANMANLAASLLDSTILDNAVKQWSDRNGNIVYRRLPGAMAQQTVLLVKDNFTGFFNASAKYALEPNAFTGRPQMLRYKGKDERSVLEIPLMNVHGALPKTKCPAVPEDYEENEILPSAVLAAFSGFNVEKLIDSACKKRGLEHVTPKTERIG